VGVAECLCTWMQATTINCHFASGQRDIYLLFKLLNISHTGLLSEEEFSSIYDAVSLKWKVMSNFHSLNGFYVIMGLTFVDYARLWICHLC